MPERLDQFVYWLNKAKQFHSDNRKPMNDYELLDEAIVLLETPHLVWSADFEIIRHHLYALLVSERKSLAPHEATFDLAKELVDGYHNDLAIG